MPVYNIHVGNMNYPFPKILALNGLLDFVALINQANPCITLTPLT